MKTEADDVYRGTAGTNLTGRGREGKGSVGYRATC